MIAHAALRERGAEAALLEALRPEYEGRGFTYVIAPSDDLLPPFLKGLQPDAIARAPDRNVAVVVKRPRDRPGAVGIAEMQRLFADRPDWRFRVIVPSSDPLDALVIGEATPDAIRKRRDEVRSLALGGHGRAAFVMAWALLEAALRFTKGEARGRAQSVADVIQSLAMAGSVDAATERRLRGLVALRNSIVHGDLAAEPDAADVDSVLSAVDEAMGMAAA